MKKVTITKGTVALTFKNNEFYRVLKSGKHKTKWGEEIKLYDMTQSFTTEVPLKILLEDLNLRELLHVINVEDHEICLTYIDGNFNFILEPGTHLFWNEILDYDFKKVNLSNSDVITDISKNLFQNSEILKFIRVYTVENYEKGLLFKDGKFDRYIETGVHHFWQNSTQLNVIKADMRQQQLEVSGQEILTFDKAAIRISLFLTYRVSDIDKALIDNKDYQKQLYLLVQLALREYVGTLTLDELLERKSSISDYIIQTIEKKVKSLGIQIFDVGIRDIILPGEVKSIMNQVLIAQKKAQANTITRREETASTRSLLNTAKLMEDNKMLYKLKEMESIERIADKINSISVSGGNQVIDQLRELFV